MSLRGTALAAAAITWLALAPLGPASRAQPRMRRVGLLFHVAELDGRPVADEPFLAEQLRSAARIYGKHAIELVRVGRRSLPARHARLLSRSDRDALARKLEPRVVNCFVVEQLMDVDEPGRERRGVHWRARGARLPRPHFVVVSRISGPYVLAHELGHFFGNPSHSQVAGNLMSYERTDAEPFLDRAQVARVHETLSALEARGELAALEARR